MGLPLAEPLMRAAAALALGFFAVMGRAKHLQIRLVERRPTVAALDDVVDVDPSGCAANLAQPTAFADYRRAEGLPRGTPVEGVSQFYSTRDLASGLDPSRVRRTDARLSETKARPAAPGG